jgi:CheY-like chemotaxis protein
MPDNRVRVLIADDDQDTADTLAMLIGMMGFEVRVAYDGATAVKTADGFRPDAAILDAAMPGMDGYEAARQIRQLPELERVLLICLSGYGRDEDRERAKRAGFDHHMTKPANLADLQRLLQSARPTSV